MRSHKPRLYSTALIMADIVGLLHFLVVNVIFILGDLTPIFVKFGGEHPGLTFIFAHIDLPLALVFSGLLTKGSDLFVTILTAEVIFIASSLLYGLLVFLLLKFLTLFFNVMTGKGL